MLNLLVFLGPSVSNASLSPRLPRASHQDVQAELPDSLPADDAGDVVDPWLELTCWIGPMSLVYIYICESFFTEVKAVRT